MAGAGCGVRQVALGRHKRALVDMGLCIALDPPRRSVIRDETMRDPNRGLAAVGPERWRKSCRTPRVLGPRHYPTPRGLVLRFTHIA